MKGEPSWRTAVTEAGSARRHVAQASEALARLAREVAALREWGDSMARLAVARRLSEGSDGGALTALLVAASDDGPSSAEVRAAASVLLSRLTEALGLEPVARRGELLRLLPEELAEFDVRGLPPEPSGVRSLYCVVRPGWWLGPLVVDRPLLEPAGYSPAEK
ncbi:MAG TPA: hypothetical protein VGB87_06515 [Vicinamibacteria bacterium]